MGVNYAKLVQQGRAKAPGVAWNKEEQNARYVLEIPAEFVRDGVLTLEEYEKAKVNPGEEVKMEQVPMQELVDEARSHGINSNPDADRLSLIGLIRRARARRKENKSNEGNAQSDDESGKSPENSESESSQDGGGDETPQGNEDKVDSAPSGGSNEGGEKVQRSAETQ